MNPEVPAPVVAAATRVGTPQLALALAKAQGAFRAIQKNRRVQIYSEKKNTRYEFFYADLEELIDATRPALAANGLAVVQEINNGQLITVLLHESGEERVSTIPLGGQGDDIKVYGAKISYLRRYAYQSLLCLAADDDLDENGESISDKVRAERPQIHKPQQSQPAQDEKPTPVEKPKPAAPPAGNDDGNPGPAVSESQVKILRARLNAAGINEADLAEQFGVADISKIPASSCNPALDWIKGRAKK